jgi:DNA polymerase-1
MRLYILDAFALIYRAYFALSKTPLVNSKGFNVTAIQGFVSTIQDIISKEKPTHLIVAFDSKTPTFRELEYAAYKAQREEMPEDIRAALPYIEQIVAAMNIPLLQLDGYEADDIVGTLSKRAATQGYTVYMVTFDKDYGQLVQSNVFIHKPPYLKAPREILGIKEVCAKWDIDQVSQVIDLLGLMGDASDNIPGVKGVGEKTAVKLLKDFGTIENLLENTAQLSGKLRENIENGREAALLSKRLATIHTEVPIEFDLSDAIIKPANRIELAKIFVELEFRTLGKRILGDAYDLNKPNGGMTDIGGTAPNAGIGDLFSSAINTAQNLFSNTDNTTTTTDNNADPETAATRGFSVQNTAHNYYIANSDEQIDALVAALLQQENVCFDTETTGIDALQAEIVGMSFAWQAHEAWYVPMPAQKSEASQLLQRFRPFFEHENIAKIGQNIKYDLLLLKKYGIEIKGKIHDTMLAHYILEPEMRHNMNLLAESYLGYTPVSIEELIGKKGKNQLSMRQVPLERIAEYAAEDADITLRLHQYFLPKLQASNMYSLYENIETPLVTVLADMENEGIAIDTAFLKRYSEEVTAEMLNLSNEIFAIAGDTFNLDSPKQLGNILFDKLKIPYDRKKTATGQYSTDEETLQSLAASYPIAALLLDYRELTKLRSTYIDALPALINPQTGRVHTTYNQAVAATGRLSSTAPNLQNIPIRTERGREIRKAFIPRNDDYVLLAADYSQIELRIMAAMSQDENMIAAFKDGLDIHRATAAKVYNIAPEEVTSEMRRRAKMVNFGIIYGITAFGLAQRLGIPRSEAKEIIDAYFTQYPAVKTCMDKSIADARACGYAKTLGGRQRFLKDLQSGNAAVRQFAERNAINTPIQGSAADMIKLAMINIHRELKSSGLKTKMLLQVHDELVFDVPRNEVQQARELIERNMINALLLPNVPIEVGMATGENWLAAH